MPQDKFAIGDRVQRRVDVMSLTSGYRRGTVIARYRDYSKFHNPKLNYPELYQVEWDDGQVEKGFLPHGLQPELIAPVVDPVVKDQVDWTLKPVHVGKKLIEILIANPLMTLRELATLTNGDRKQVEEALLLRNVFKVELPENLPASVLYALNKLPVNEIVPFYEANKNLDIADGSFNWMVLDRIKQIRDAIRLASVDKGIESIEGKR